MMRALFALGIGNSCAMLAHECDGDDANVEPGVTAWDQEIEAVSTPHWDVIGLPEAPDAVGFFVWEGTRMFFHEYEGGTVDVDFDGLWRKAKAGEVVRFITGRPVFAEEH